MKQGFPAESLHTKSMAEVLQNAGSMNTVTMIRENRLLIWKTMGSLLPLQLYVNTTMAIPEELVIETHIIKKYKTKYANIHK